MPRSPEAVTPCVGQPVTCVGVCRALARTHWKVRR